MALLIVCSKPPKSFQRLSVFLATILAQISTPVRLDKPRGARCFISNTTWDLIGLLLCVTRIAPQRAIGADAARIFAAERLVQALAGDQQNDSDQGSGGHTADRKQKNLVSGDSGPRAAFGGRDQRGHGSVPKTIGVGGDQCPVWRIAGALPRQPLAPFEYPKFAVGQLVGAPAMFFVALPAADVKCPAGKRVGPMAVEGAGVKVSHILVAVMKVEGSMARRATLMDVPGIGPAAVF